MSSPFTTQFGQEILTSEVTSRDGFELILALLAILVTSGIDRVEQAIKNTYTKDAATIIIDTMNQTMAAVVD